MTDMTSNPPRRSTTGRRRTAEFWVYFTLIFLCAVPFTTFRWVREIAERHTLNVRGPLARAWSEADRITPLIFSV